MYCRNCGTQLDETAGFCPNCGTPVANQNQPLPNNNGGNLFNPQQYGSLVNNAMQDEMFMQKNISRVKTALILGILSVVCSALNYIGVYYSHIAGIVLGIIAISIVTPLRKYMIKNANAALVTGIVGLSLGTLAFFIGFFYGIFA